MGGGGSQQEEEEEGMGCILQPPAALLLWMSLEGPQPHGTQSILAHLGPFSGFFFPFGGVLLGYC